MALIDVSGFKSYSELRGQILPAGKTQLVDRINHYNFGTKTQEFAVPLGVDVSMISFVSKLIRLCPLQSAIRMKASDAVLQVILRVCGFHCVVFAPHVLSYRTFILIITSY